MDVFSSQSVVTYVRGGWQARPGGWLLLSLSVHPRASSSLAARLPAAYDKLPCY